MFATFCHEGGFGKVLKHIGNPSSKASYSGRRLRHLNEYPALLDEGHTQPINKPKSLSQHQP